MRSIHPFSPRIPSIASLASNHASSSKLPLPNPLLSSPRRRCLSSTPCCYATHYQTLQVPEGSSRAEIKSAFHKLSKRYHPDSSSPYKSATKFAALSEAYTVLGDDTSRRRYDQSLNSPFSSSSSSSSSSYGFGYGYGPSPNEARRQSATYAWEHTKRANDRMRSRASSFHQQHQQQSQHSRTNDEFNSRADRYARMNTNWGTGARLREEAARAAAREAGHAVSIGKKIGQIVSICFIIYLFAGAGVKAEEKEEEEKERDRRRFESVDRRKEEEEER